MCGVRELLVRFEIARIRHNQHRTLVQIGGLGASATWSPLDSRRQRLFRVLTAQIVMDECGPVVQRCEQFEIGRSAIRQPRPRLGRSASQLWNSTSRIAAAIICQLLRFRNQFLFQLLEPGPRQFLCG